MRAYGVFAILSLRMHEHIEHLPTIEELNRMDDLSGITLYSAELHRLPHYSHEEEAHHIDQARLGDEDARDALIKRCLPWIMAKATNIYMEYGPQHSDVMDLIGAAHLDMVEAMPNALAADKPVTYLMSVGALAMKRHCYYGDPMVRPPRYKEDRPHYDQVEVLSLEHERWPIIEAISGPDVVLTEAELEEWKIREQDQILYDVLNQLNPNYRETLTAYYGLYGHPMQRAGDIAAERGMNKKAVEHVIRRAKDKVAEKLGPFVTTHANEH